jgi:hypothetical protein
LFDVSLYKSEITGHFYHTWFELLGTIEKFATDQMTIGTVSYDGVTFRPYQRDVSFAGALGSVGYNLNADGHNTLHIGTGIHSNYDNYVGDIAETLIYSEVLAEVFRLTVECYLYTKFSGQPNICNDGMIFP